MGDRRHCILRFNPAPENDDPRDIYLYTHWGGANLPRDVAAALDSVPARRRWHDDTYLARIIIDQLTRDARDTELGYGLAPFPIESEYDHDVIVNVSRGTVDYDESGPISFPAFINRFNP